VLRLFAFSHQSRHAEVMMSNQTASRFSGLREIPPAVWALGFVSLLMDASSGSFTPCCRFILSLRSAHPW
jgi:hypothetical protein